MKNRVKQLRTENKMTLRELAEYVGIDHTAISRIENNDRNLYDSDIIKLCKIFNVTSDYLLCLSEHRHYPNIQETPNNGVQLALYNATRALNEEEQKQILDFVNYIKSKKRG